MFNHNVFAIVALTTTIDPALLMIIVLVIFSVTMTGIVALVIIISIVYSMKKLALQLIQPIRDAIGVMGNIHPIQDGSPNTENIADEINHTFTEDY